MKKNLILLLMLTFLLMGCLSEAPEEENSIEFFSMNTTVSILATGENTTEVLNEAKNKTLDLENKWSVTLQTSEVYAINHSDGNSITVSEDTKNLIDFSVEIASKTNGSFEPTIYPIVSLWGFTTRQFYVPTQEEIDEALQYVGYDKISVVQNTVTLPKGMSLDFGAVGKGYAVDEVLTILKQHNISSGMVNFGGNIGLIGKNQSQEKWQIGVKDPQSEGNLGILQLESCVVATSGNYQRYFEDEEGNRYGHIMNPITGKPQDSEILSVTVVAAEGKICDALATAIYVMGVEEAINLWQEENNFELLIITKDNKAFITENLMESFIVSKEDLEIETITK